MPETITKDPDKVRAGQASARLRWGEQPRVIRLDELTAPQRAVVIALVEAHRSANKSVGKAGDDAS